MNNDSSLPNVPQAYELEKAVLGTILLDNTALDELTGILSPRHFFAEQNASAYALALELRRDGVQFDSPVFAQSLRQKYGLAESDASFQVATLMDGQFRVQNVHHYAERIVEAAKRRFAAHALSQLTRGLTESDMSLEDVATALQRESDALRCGSKRQKLRRLTAAELLQQPIPPREMLLAPILPAQSLTMLHAKRGIGKTFLALGIAHAVATGTKFLKWESPVPRGVLYVDGELPASTLKERVQIMMGGASSRNLGIITPDLQDFSLPDLASREGQALVEEYLDGVALLILDNLSALVRAGKENEGESWLPVQDWLLSLRRRGISVLFLHHGGKDGAQRGTSRREDVLDTVMALRRPRDYQAAEGLRVEVSFEKARGLWGEDVRPFEAKMVTWPDRADWTTRDNADVQKSQVVALLAEGNSVRQVSKETGVPSSTVQRWKKE
jgi:putative DNA primase/helicase